MPFTAIDVTGQRYNRLVALRSLGKVGTNTCWLFRCDCGKEKRIALSNVRNGHVKSCGCLNTELTTRRNQRAQDRVPVLVRLRAMIQEVPSGCWIWMGTTPDGYGRITIPSRKRTYLAHRVAYEALVGPIPTGLTLDHLCHNDDLSCLGGERCQHRACVNPDHLEVVTLAENGRRQGARRRLLAAMRRAA
jgi:hypothetical protein